MVSRWNDLELLRRLDDLAQAERKSLPDMLACLAEVERRGLHLDRGFPTLFDYCVERLKWGEGAAMQRLIVSRAATLHHEVYSYLRDGQLNLSAVSRLAPFLTAENRTEILSRAAGRKRAALDEMLGELRAEAARQAAVPPGAGSDVTPESILPFAGTSGRAPVPDVDVPADATLEASSPAPMEPPSRLSFPAGEYLRRDLDRARRLLKRRCPSGRLEELIAYLLHDFLRRFDPDTRMPARERQRREKETRRIPQWVKDRVWVRDGGGCSYVSPEGQRCTARKSLEYDHIRPWARGGSSDDPGNIRLLCRAHNLFLARRDFGARVPLRRNGMHAC